MPNQIWEQLQRSSLHEPSTHNSALRDRDGPFEREESITCGPDLSIPLGRYIPHEHIRSHETCTRELKPAVTREQTMFPLAERFQLTGKTLFLAVRRLFIGPTELHDPLKVDLRHMLDCHPEPAVFVVGRRFVAASWTLDNVVGGYGGGEGLNTV